MLPTSIDFVDNISLHLSYQVDNNKTKIMEKVNKNRIAVPLQPKKADDPIYSLLQKYITARDHNEIAAKYNVVPLTIQRACTGKGILRNPKIWEAIVRIAVDRKETEKAFTEQYINK